jgi:hypothetical protein
LFEASWEQDEAKRLLPPWLKFEPKAKERDQNKDQSRKCYHFKNAFFFHPGRLVLL